MENKQLIPYVKLDTDISPETVIRLEHMGADSVFLSALSETMTEGAVIKWIKTVCEVSDMPLMVLRPYRRLEDVKKILYAGAAKVVMPSASEADLKLIKETSDRFGSEKVLAWIWKGQKMTDQFLEMLADLGCSGYLAEDLTERTFFSERKLSVYPILSELDGDRAALWLKKASVAGVISEAFSKDTVDLMGMKHSLKESGISTNCFESALSFGEFKLNSDGLIPVITQDYKTGQVLMMAYMNEEAFNETIRSGRMTYWSRSRQELWKKGDTSGHCQYVKSLDIDCDRDTILAKVAQIGAACHTGNESCFFTNLVSKAYDDTNPTTIFDQVMHTITERRDHPKEGSYTNYLFDQGIDKILKKVGEEATEIVIAAKNPDSDELKYEICDFLYHMMVLMAERGVSWKEILRELAERH